MTATTLRQSEASLQRAIIDLARATGWLVYHTHDSRHSAKGFPDLVLLRGDRVIFAELKTDVGRLTAEQLRWLDALEEAGCRTRVWRPADWDQIATELR